MGIIITWEGLLGYWGAEEAKAKAQDSNIRRKKLQGSLILNQNRLTMPTLWHNLRKNRILKLFWQIHLKILK
jgi:hypothetical protein